MLEFKPYVFHAEVEFGREKLLQACDSNLRDALAKKVRTRSSWYIEDQNGLRVCVKYGGTIISDGFAKTDNFKSAFDELRQAIVEKKFDKKIEQVKMSYRIRQCALYKNAA